jgi:hypothetical protein
VDPASFHISTKSEARTAQYQKVPTTAVHTSAVPVSGSGGFVWRFRFDNPAAISSARATTFVLNYTRPGNKLALDAAGPARPKLVLTLAGQEDNTDFASPTEATRAPSRTITPGEVTRTATNADRPATPPPASRGTTQETRQTDTDNSRSGRPQSGGAPSTVATSMSPPAGATTKPDRTPVTVSRAERRLDKAQVSTPTTAGAPPRPSANATTGARRAPSVGSPATGQLPSNLSTSSSASASSTQTHNREVPKSGAAGNGPESSEGSARFRRARRI